MKVNYFVSFASGVEEIVKSDDIWVIQQPHHLQLTILHSKQHDRLDDTVLCFTHQVTYTGFYIMTRNQ